MQSEEWRDIGGIKQADGVATWRVVGALGEWYVSEANESACWRTDFLATPAEARAVLRTPETFVGGKELRPPITREEFLAFVRSSGDAALMESVTPVSSDKPCYPCPGCGLSMRSSRNNQRHESKRWWHGECLARVQAPATTTAAPSEEPWLLKELRKSTTSAEPPRARKLRVGDPVRGRISMRYAVVDEVDALGYISVRYTDAEGGVTGWRDADIFTLVTSSPPEPAVPEWQDRCRVHGGSGVPGPGCEQCERHELPTLDSEGRAVLPTPTTEPPEPRACDHCYHATGGPEYSLCDDCCTETEECGSSIGVCIHCGCRPNEYVAPDLSLTNEVGFPTMPQPEQDIACACGARSDFTTLKDDEGRPVCVPCNQQREYEYGRNAPRVGDLVEWAGRNGAPTRGVVIPTDPVSRKPPEPGHLFARHWVEHETTFTVVAVERCTVVQKRESL